MQLINRLYTVWKSGVTFRSLNWITPVGVYLYILLLWAGDDLQSKILRNKQPTTFVPIGIIKSCGLLSMCVGVFGGIPCLYTGLISGQQHRTALWNILSMLHVGSPFVRSPIVQSSHASSIHPPVYLSLCKYDIRGLPQDSRTQRAARHLRNRMTTKEGNTQKGVSFILFFQWGELPTCQHVLQRLKCSENTST